MSEVGEKETKTQQRVVRLFQHELGYRYLGNWKERPDNRDIEAGLLGDWLLAQGHPQDIVEKMVQTLQRAGAVGGTRTLYDANREVYELLRYGAHISPAPGENKQTYDYIDWEHPERNDFAIAQEVTVATRGGDTRRPDIVLYVNGIAIGMLELKRSTVSVAQGIRQLLGYQDKLAIQSFFATNQLVMAGNDTEGLRYGAIGTKEKYFLNWKEDSPVANLLDRGLCQLCQKRRLLEIIHDFMVYDAGTKKTCRHNQYFGVRAAQVYASDHQGGIIWHTQGSGKSLTMVWLAKWIRENIEGSRVLIITDRTELDEQIEKVFKGVDEDIYRTSSGADLVKALGHVNPWLICSLMQKFGASDEGDVDVYVAELDRQMPDGFKPRGDIFVFVDECHRTQSGKLHQAMDRLLPEATLIGFTGTPLLKKDKEKSLEVFGPYIHTYKYDEAVRDGVVLDLRYEARAIEQRMTSPQRIDQWFDVKTRGLTEVGKAQVKERWGTMQKLLSSQERLEEIVADILMDMETRPRLQSGQGNAMLVCDSVYAACRVYEMLEQTDLAGKCAIVTSYKPSPADIRGEESGEGANERLEKYRIYRRMLADHFDEPEDAAMNKVDEFELNVKKRFIEEPGQMKLLIVVDKLLTGFDAPSATYLYIDKQMCDHGLFQAICRVNRLDGEDKDYGYIVDYRDLFQSLDKSIHDYTSEVFDGFDAADVAGLLTSRLEQGRQRLDETLEAVKALCEPVELPCDTTAYMHFFCGQDSGNADELKDNEPKRVSLYKLVASLLRAYLNIANEMEDAGYTAVQAAQIKADVTHYQHVRDEIRLSSGDYVDMKMYEPAMRQLMDRYIQAEESAVISKFNDMTLIELIVERGGVTGDLLPKPIRKNKEAMAETIENNVRRKIIDESAVNPKYYEEMSELLEALIDERKRAAISYETYLDRIVELTQKVHDGGSRSAYPAVLDTGARRALYDNLGKDTELAVKIDEAILGTKKDSWRGNHRKEREIQLAIEHVLQEEDASYDPAEVLEIVKHQRDYN